MNRLRPDTTWRLTGLAVAAMLFGLAPPARAQAAFLLRGFADAGATTFFAQRSFEAVLGSTRGLVLGGGVEAVLLRHIFVDLRASRFRRTGQRVFVFNDETFHLGIPVTVTITPVELNGGYRFFPGSRLVPYAGAGIGWHRYKETSAFADASENLADRFVGFQVLGGAEVRMARWIGAAFDATWATVPGALGEDANSVSREFQESDLGGVTLRVKVIVGRE
ncbi:MAG: hypothetical protein ACRD3C_17315 [Vicinamibacterales bacterium]